MTDSNTNALDTTENRATEPDDSNPSAKMESVGGPKLEQNETYISPSDAILSPTTQKLNQMKGKRLG